MTPFSAASPYKAKYLSSDAFQYLIKSNDRNFSPSPLERTIDFNHFETIFDFLWLNFFMLRWTGNLSRLPEEPGAYNESQQPSAILKCLQRQMDLKINVN